MWLDGRLSKGMEIGLDLGCQKMRNYPVFRTKRYIGVDYVEHSLRLGLKERPKAEPILARIEDFDKYPNGDFVLCVQVFQLVDQFDTPNTVPILKGIIGKTNPGGMLLVNFGAANMPYIAEIRDVLKSSFSAVDEIDPPKGNGLKKYFRCVGRH